MNPSTALSLAILLSFAFVANLPLGFLRETTRKFSVRWFVYIHLSIPFIVALRMSTGLGWNIIPFSVASAVAGQVIGSRIRRRSRG